MLALVGLGPLLSAGPTSYFEIELLLLCIAHVVSSPCADVCVAATVRGGHSGSDQTDVSRASDQSPQTNFPGGL